MLNSFVEAPHWRSEYFPKLLWDLFGIEQFLMKWSNHIDFFDKRHFVYFNYILCKQDKTQKSFQNLEILFTVQVSHMQHFFLKWINMKLAKTRKEKKMHIIFSKIAIYKNRAYKYCTAIVSKNILLQNS